MTDIRTPDDEITTPGYFYSPFREGWWYQGATYPGHSDYSVDWNRRTKDGGWLDDRGDPVLAAADGTVVDVVESDGTVKVNHFGGLWQTVYRHMQPTLVKEGQKVQRGDIVGRIGEAGNAPNGTHLHMEVWKRDKTSEPFRRTKQRFMGRAIEASVGDSNTTAAGTDMPGPVMVQGPPARATWESAFKEAAKALTETRTLLETVRDARDAARAERDAASQQAEELTASLKVATDALDAAKARIAELEAGQTPTDCATVEAERDAAEAERDAALKDLLTAQKDRDAAKLAAEQALTALERCEAAAAPHEAFVAEVDAARQKLREAV